MKITRVEMYSGSEMIAEFNISDLSSKSPYVVKSIAGLDADEIQPMFQGNSLDGRGGFYEFAMPQRHIAIKTTLKPELRNSGVTRSNLRDHLYAAIAKSRTGVVDLRFFNGADCLAHIFGRIVKMEADHFAKEAVVTLTIRCEDPFLYGMTKHVGTPNVEVDAATNVMTMEVNDFLSTAPHGFVINLRTRAVFDTFVITDRSGTWTFTLDITDGLSGVDDFVQSGSLLVISSVEHNNYVALYPSSGGQPVRLANKIAVRSVWPILYPGLNDFLLAAKLFSANVEPPDVLSIEWRPKFWGV